MTDDGIIAPDPAWRLGEAAVAAIAAGRHADPFAVLGPHAIAGGVVVRAFVAAAEAVDLVDLAGKVIASMDRRHEDGVFEVALKKDPGAYRLSARNAGGAWTLEDPYRFAPVLGSLDDHLLAEGTHSRLWDKLGAHVIEHQGAKGTHFAVWAPNARRVSVVGAFNDWDGRRHPMRKRVDTGVWEIFLPGIGEGALYKYEIIGPTGAFLPLKSDPLAFSAEMRPGTASKVASPKPFEWTDAAYRASAPADWRRAPVSIYEVHLGSWRRGERGRFMTYDELADTLVPYIAGLGFTHIELLPITEHPLDASWGYQPTGLFAPTSRFGDPDAFARLVDRAHAAGLGVILDWVPAHFPTDAHGLYRFDGTPLYEHPDNRRGFHPDWNTAIYDFGRREIANFLVANAKFWMERFHIDGLRVDAVASMLYLDYSRKEGEWLPNDEGGRENKEAIDFLRRMNREVYGAFNGALTIAEESTAWPGVSQPVHAGGLGFGFKWNMGFMHDTLAYLAKEGVHRAWHHDLITFGMIYAFSENFVLALSHDEVVHGKASLVNKMAGLEGEKFATLRAYYGLMWGYPGKKLLFMGQEFAQRREWNENVGLDWELLDTVPHRGMADLVRDLNRLYRQKPALHARDCEGDGFEWLIVDDKLNSVFAFARHAPDANPVAVIVNMTPVQREHYVLPLPRPGRWVEVLNTDAAIYGGANRGNMGQVLAYDAEHAGKPAHAHLLLPPLAAIFLEWSPS